MQAHIDTRAAPCARTALLGLLLLSRL